MIRTPTGMMSEEDVQSLFDQVGFEPPPGASMQDAFMMLLMHAQRQQMEAQAAQRRGRGRTAQMPETEAAAVDVLGQHGATVTMLEPCGCEVRGVDVAAAEGSLEAAVAGALERLMAVHGFVLLRGQGTAQRESGVAGTYLSGEQQCALSECFGAGQLHSTHGVHPEAPCRDVFRLSNDPDHGFNSVGPEWHNDGSFCREVFGHVVYHIVKAPAGAGNTVFAHLGLAYDKLPPAVQARLRRCASVNSNGGAVHPLAHDHPVSGRGSLYLHLGMTGCILEALRDGPAAEPGPPAPDPALAGFGDGRTPAELPQPKAGNRAGLGPGVRAWTAADMDPFFGSFSALLDRPDVCYSHKWQEGDVVVIDNLAVAHKASPGAHRLDSGLRILHRTTVLSARPFDPHPALGIPHSLPTDGPCPFAAAGAAPAVWEEGYVGFRWGAWEARTVPH